MAELILRVNPSPAALLREAAGADDGFRFEDAFLLLRQGGIRDDLLALAGGAGHPGWFSPPFCVFHELSERFGATTRVPLTGDERSVLSEQLMRSHGGAVFGQLERLPEFVDAVETLIGEFVAEGVSPDSLAEAVGRSEVAEDWDRERNLAVAAVYRAYHAELGRDPRNLRRDGRDTFADVAAAIGADPDGFSRGLGGRRELRIVGLTDLRGGWRRLLESLAASPALDRVVIYSLDEHLLEEGLVPSRVDRAPPPPKAKVTVLHAPDSDREVEEVAVRVRGLLEAGVPAPRIAVVSRKARPHVDLVLAALERAGVPATARRRVGYREIPVVKSLVALFQAAAEGWTRHGLSELARQPYFGRRLDIRVIDFLGYRSALTGLDGWQAALDGLVAEAEAYENREEGDDDRRGWLPSSDRAKNARKRFEEFATVAAGLDQEATLAEWLGWLDDFLAADTWEIERRIRKIPAGRWEVARVDLAGWKALKETVSGWRVALDKWSTDADRLDAEAFLTRLGTVVAGDAALWTTCRRGVAVLEGLAAVYRDFDHLFVIGLEAGTFPTRRPRSPILHEEDRQALVAVGLPLDLEPIWEARELSLFRALVAGAPNVTLSHAVLGPSGREVVSSVFLEEVQGWDGLVEESLPTSRVLTPGLPLFRDGAVVEFALGAAKMESVRETGALHPWNGLIESPALLAKLGERFGEDYLWSPTQLEGYAKCPWSWFSSRLLKVAKHEDPDQEIDAAVRGTLWHAALEGFWSHAIAKFDRDGRTGEKRMLRSADADWALPMLSEAVDVAWTSAGDSEWLGHSAMRDVTRDALRATLVKYLDWEMTLNDDAYDSRKRNAPKMVRTAVEAHELKIDRVALERNGVRFVFRGSIDRVEVGVDERVPSEGLVAAVDYKSSVYSTPGGGDKKAWADDIVLQVPLYAYALTQVRPGSRVARVEYRAIRQQKQAHALSLFQVAKDKKKNLTLVVDDEAVGRMEQALVAATGHVGSVRTGRFPAKPAPSSKCPPFCAAWDICRIPGGPQGMIP